MHFAYEQYGTRLSKNMILLSAEEKLHLAKKNLFIFFSQQVISFFSLAFQKCIDITILWWWARDYKFLSDYLLPISLLFRLLVLCESSVSCVGATAGWLTDLPVF